MKFESLELPGLFRIIPRRHEDARGYFAEVFRDDLFRRHVGDVAFVQHNQSLSRRRGTVRGLHFQSHPASQGKLVRCVRGAVFDVAVDLRASAPTFGRHVAVELTAGNGAQLWIPVGFAHGFCTLEPDTEVLYSVTAPYCPSCDAGLFWRDPDLDISWPIPLDEAVLSAKDERQPRLKDLRQLF